jgi:hypothetical protein
MDEEMTMPDFSKPLTKELKKEKIKIDKIYKPFLMKFFGGNGIFTSALKGLHNMLMTNLMKLIDIVGKVYGSAEAGNEQDKKNEEPEKEKKKKQWLTEKAQKLYKSQFFQKTLGFLKGMASVSFITELLVFLMLLRMGVIQKFLPWILGIIGDAVESLIKFLPTLLKMFWKLLWETIPRILKSIFRTVLDMFGLKNPIWGKITDMIAQFLPLILAIGCLLNKFGLLGEVLKGVGWVFGKIFFYFRKFGIFAKLLAGVGKIFSGIWLIIGKIILGVKLLFVAVATFLGLPVWVVAVIAAAIVAIGVLIWKFRKQIWEWIKKTASQVKAFYIKLWNGLKSFFTWIWKATEGVRKIIVNVYTVIAKAAFKVFDFIFLAPLRKAFKFFSKIAAPVTKKLGPVIESLSSVFDTIKTKITNVFGPIAKAIEDMFMWFSGISAFGGYDWMAMKKSDREKYLKSVEVLRENKLVKAAKNELSEDELKTLSSTDRANVQKLKDYQKELGTKDLVEALAAQNAGLIEKMESLGWGREKKAQRNLDFIITSSPTLRNISGN